jgi:solute carrier family 25 oxoglutarate transporter 11
MATATIEKAPNAVAKGLEPFVCGGSAATFASVIIHPMDLAKVNT